ncbi:MAG: cardiolipin synthase [Candidatus Omnitrophica bacterium]|nr:cardiolipin synthase [Candidatus Omnitrophota bacterium]
MTGEIWKTLVVFYYIYLIITIVYLVLDNRETSATFAWIFVLSTFPVIGLFLYLLIGRNRRRSHKLKQYQQHVNKSLRSCLKEYIDAQDRNLEKLSRKEGFSSRKKLFDLLYRNSNSLLTTKNAIRLFYCGKDKFDSLITDLQNAKKCIHLEYFIWRSDTFTEKIKNILIEKKREGVDVRILYDIIGSLQLKASYTKELRTNGIKIYPYDNVRSFITAHSLNYRNHRKIAVIDGSIAYTGGMNMGKEYIDGGGQFEAWRDTHARLEGEAVAILQSIFIANWYNTTKEELIGMKYFPKISDSSRYVPMQITASGPDSEWSSIEQLYFNLITSAQKCICIQSPYFIPNESIYKSLLTAALSGIEVKIMIAGKADKLLPYWAAFSFFGPLLKAGVRMYHYQKGFMHAKTIIVDEEISSVGTANMDIRSFQLNYEVNMLLYDNGVTKDLVGQFNKDLEYCDELTLEEYYKIGKLKHFRNSIARLFAPLM